MSRGGGCTTIPSSFFSTSPWVATGPAIRIRRRCSRRRCAWITCACTSGRHVVHLDQFGQVHYGPCMRRRKQVASVRKAVSLYEAKTHLSELVELAAQGREIVIAKSGKPKARLVPLAPLLMAQALDEGLTILTSDRAFEPYRVPVVWA